MQRIVKYKGLRLGLLLTFLITLISVGAEAADKNEERRLLEDFKTGNHIALMRHALAPGTGDPENFMLGDCTTQRNLSQAGRDQAKRIGDRFKQAGITVADVYTSEWCSALKQPSFLDLAPPCRCRRSIRFLEIMIEKVLRPKRCTPGSPASSSADH